MPPPPTPATRPWWAPDQEFGSLLAIGFENGVVRVWNERLESVAVLDVGEGDVEVRVAERERAHLAQDRRRHLAAKAEHVLLRVARLEHRHVPKLKLERIDGEAGDAVAAPRGLLQLSHHLVPREHLDDAAAGDGAGADEAVACL